MIINPSEGDFQFKLNIQKYIKTIIRNIPELRYPEKVLYAQTFPIFSNEPIFKSRSRDFQVTIEFPKY